MDPTVAEIPLTPSITAYYNFQLPIKINQTPTSTQKRHRKLTPQGRLDAAETRRRGACRKCRLKKIKCSHASQKSAASKTPSNGLLTFQQPTPSTSATTQQAFEIFENIVPPPPRQGYGIRNGIFEGFSEGVEHSFTKAGGEGGFGGPGGSWNWSKLLLMDESSMNGCPYNGEPFTQILDMVCEPFSESSLAQIHTGENPGSDGRTKLRGANSNPLEQLVPHSETCQTMVPSQSVQPQTGSSVLWLQDSNKSMQKSDVDRREGANLMESATDEQKDAESKLNITSDNRYTAKGPEDSLHSIKWPLSVPKLRSRKRRLDGRTVNVASAPRPVRRPCANKISATSQTWKCCCGRSVLKSPCSSDQGSRNKVASQIEQRPTARQSTIGAESLGAGASIKSISKPKDTDQTSKGPRSGRKMQVYIDPSSPTTRRHTAATATRPEAAYHPDFCPDLFGDEASEIPEFVVTAPNYDFGSATNFFNPFSGSGADLCNSRPDTRNISNDYSPVACFSNQRTEQPATPSGGNKYGGNVSAGPLFNLQTPSTRRHMQIPDLSFTSSSSTETPQSMTVTPVTVSRNYDFSHGAEMFGKAPRKLDFGSQSAKPVKTTPDNDEFNLDFEFFPVNGAELFPDFGLFTP